MLETKSSSVALTCDLINCKSVTPDDGGCQKIIGDRLSALGFSLEHMRFGNVDNLWARKGNTSPLFVFAGHTDVVPTGRSNNGSHHHFKPLLKMDMYMGAGLAI